MKKFNMATYILIAIFVFIFIPLGIAFLVSFDFINTDTSNEWIGFWGGYLGAIIGGLITLFVMKKSLDSGKEERRINFCELMVDRLICVNKKASTVTLKSQTFLTSAMQQDIDDAIKSKNSFLDEVWGTIIRLEAKKAKFKYCSELIQDLNLIAGNINSFSVSNLNYCDDTVDNITKQKLLDSKEYKSETEKCRAAAKNIEELAVRFGDHMKLFYQENT